MIRYLSATAIVVLTSLLAAAGLIAYAAWAGPLDPPVGPVTSTYKTLAEVEPRIAINATNTPGDPDSTFKITLPGSYYLTGNITGAVGKRGIEIAASNITIDLNGFTLQGVAASLQGIAPPTESPTVHRVAVRNGTVVGWGGAGVDLAPPGAGNTESTVEHIRAASNGFVGLRVADGSTIISCTASSNGNAGITCAGQVVVEDSISRSNTGSGFSCSNGSMHRGCSALLNGGDGYSGQGLYTSCAAYQNTGIGFNAINGASIIADCTSNSNTSHGIVATNQTVVRHCAVRQNGNNGIEVQRGCLILENDCAFNGAGTGVTGAGIHCSGAFADSRIERNTVSNNDIGIWVESAGHFIAGNIATGNTTSFSIIAGNAVAPIVGATTNPALITGTYSGNLGSTDPNANFVY